MYAPRQYTLLQMLMPSAPDVENNSFANERLDLLPDGKSWYLTGIPTPMR